MDIVAVLTKKVEIYRKRHGRRPGRIVLDHDAADAMAAEMVRAAFNKKTPDEEFLDGGVAYFHGIPVIAQLEPGEELAIEH